MAHYTNKPRPSLADINKQAIARATALSAVFATGGVSSALADNLVAENDAPRKMEAVNVNEERTEDLAAPKFNTPLVDTPQTITVIPKRIIEEQGATNLRDILRNSPGITFQAGEGGTPAGDQMSIRGFSARTDMFIDGVRDLGGYARDSFNLEQVEIAKGPSSSSAGRGSTGGSVNLVTKSPHSSAEKHATVAVGTDDFTRATVDVNQPIDDSKAIRLNLLTHDTGVPGRDVVENSSWGIAPSLALGLGKPTKLIFAYQYLEQDNVPDFGMPRQAFEANPTVPYSNWYGLRARDHEKIEQDLGTITIEHEGDGFTVRNLTRYGRTYRDSVHTSPRMSRTSSVMVRRDDWKSRDQTDEVLANQTHLDAEFTTGRINHAISAGLEIVREEVINYSRSEQAGTVLPETDLYAPNTNDPYNGNITRNGAYTNGKADTIALYLFDNIFAGQKWQIVAGLRYDIFDSEYDSVDSSGAKTSYARTDRELSGRVGFVYKPTAKSSIYAGYANSFNPSAEGLSLATRGGSLEDVAPEKTNSYEVGTKWELMENRLSLGAALFRTEKTNARTPGVNPNDPPTVLEGRERVDGVEVNLAGRLTREWEIFAGFALMDSQVEASNTAGLAGAELGLTPKTSFNLWSTYRLPCGLTIGGCTQYTDSVPRNTSAAPDTIPSYWLYNAMLSYPINDTISLRLNGTNLTDEDYIDRVGGGHHVPGPGRQFILSANFSF